LEDKQSKEGINIDSDSNNKLIVLVCLLDGA